MGENRNLGVHINDLFMWCNDVNKTREFYSNILGLIEGWYDPNPKSGPPYIVYKMSNNQSLHFLQRSLNSKSDTNWSYQPSSTISNGLQKFSWTLEVSKSKAEEIQNRIKQNSIKSFQGSIETRSGYSALTILDPMGNTIDLYYLHSE